MPTETAYILSDQGLFEGQMTINFGCNQSFKKDQKMSKLFIKILTTICVGKPEAVFKAIHKWNTYILYM